METKPLINKGRFRRNNMRPILYPYKFGSNSARLLLTALRTAGHRSKRVRPDGNYSYWSNHLAINWGSSQLPQWPRVRDAPIRWINNPEHVANAANKLTAFGIMHDAGISVPEFTVHGETALGWAAEGTRIVSRTVLRGHSGEGIYLSERGVKRDDGTYPYSVRNAPLYVKYIKKQDEYRIHVFGGEVIDLQQKRKRRETPNEDVNYQVRSHENGWIFARDDIQEPHDRVLAAALAAVASLQLDFGAVDVIWNNHEQRAYVLEVNTAPGLEGTTLTKYANAIEQLI